MKKLLALLLSMTLAVSLMAPAFADGPDGPPPDDYFDGNIHWWTVEDEWQSVCEEYPERVDIFREEAEAWYAQHAGRYLWYDAKTFDEFVENAGGEEAAYLALFYDWNWAYELEQARRAFITAHGGVPGQVGVMVNGQYIRFPGAAPELADGCTMAPAQALVEALGGEVSVYGSDVRCRLDGMTVIFTAGSREAVVELKADEDEGCEQVAGVIDLDCVPYAKGGQTYVPVRFLGEALGYFVSWDGGYRTAVLLDPEALIAEMDRRFTTVNQVLANVSRTTEEGKGCRSEMKGDVTFTAFDTLNGSTTYRAGFTGRELMNGEALNGSYSITMSDSMADILMAMLMGADWDEPENGEDAAVLRTILTGLEDVEVIVTREGLYWARLPVLDELAGEGNIWCALPVDPDRAAASFAGTGTLTVGRLVAQSVYSASYVTMWSEVMEKADELAAVWGDGCFTVSGGVSTLAVGLDDMDPDGGLGMKDELDEFQFTLKVDSKGGAALSCRLQTVKGRPGMRLAVDGSLSGGQAALSVECHISNTGELKLSLSSQRRAADEEPVAQPPKGSNIVDTPELYNR